MKLKNLLRQRLPILLACGGFESIVCTSALAATTVNVTVGDDFFKPQTTNINVGDTVKWTWTGSIGHSSTSTSTPVLWDSPIQTSGTFSHTFANSGSFPYKCRVHSFQTGTVTVQAAANVPPTVSIKSPTNNSTFAAPWTGTILASTSDSDGTVSKVDFFAGTNLLGTVNNPSANPSFTVTNLAAGSYVLKAVATDNGGANSSATVTVNIIAPSPITLSAPKWVSPSSFQFSYSADPGLNYIIQRSSDLANWTALQTNLVTGSSATFVDANATGSLNFYSIKLLPNP